MENPEVQRIMDYNADTGYNIPESKASEIVSLLKITDAVIETKESCKNKQAYNLNILEEIRGNENAHSRIFVKLIAYKEENRFIHLKSLLQFLGDEFKKVIVEEPKITAEKDRIDAMIIDKKGGYGIIIENKINGAVDQNTQIDRYIENVLEKKIPLERIYILYLTRTGGAPPEESFSKINQGKFKGRYMEINYRDHILPFLEEEVLPYCRYKDVVLQSAMVQYIDYLKGIFHQRIIDRDMNIKLHETFAKSLKLGNDPDQNLLIIENTLRNLDETKILLDEQTTLNRFKRWHNNLRNDFPGLVIMDNYEDISNLPKLLVILNYGNSQFACLIEKGRKNFFIGIGRHHGSEPIKSEIKEWVLRRRLNEEYEGGNLWWYFYKTCDYNHVYTNFKTLLQKTLDELRKESNS